MYSVDWRCLEAAEPRARLAVSLDGASADARARLALVLHMKGDNKSAILEAEQALLVDPHCPEAHGVRGIALVFSGKPSEGREALRQCIQLSPRSPTLPVRLSQIAAAYYFEGDYESAILTAQQVLRIFPKNLHSYRWLAAALGQVGREAEAKDALRELTADYINRYFRPIGRKIMRTC